MRLIMAITGMHTVPAKILENEGGGRHSLSINDSRIFLSDKTE